MAGAEAEWDELLAFLADEEDGDGAVAAPSWRLSGLSEYEGALFPLPLALEPALARYVDVDSRRASAFRAADASPRTDKADADELAHDQSSPTDASDPGVQRKKLTRKQEIDALGGQIARLTIDLAGLKRSVGLDEDTLLAIVRGQGAARPGGNVNSGGRRLCLWERLAARQKALRGASGRENRQLRDAVVTHRRRARRLHHMLRKRVESEHEEFSALLSRPSAFVPAALPQDEWVFRGLATGMDDMYASIDTTFHKVKMNQVPRPGRLMSARGEGPGKWRVEFRDVHIVPFSVKETERALWIHVAGTKDCELKEARSSFQFSIQLPMGTATLQQYNLARQYKEEDRTVVVSREVTMPAPRHTVHVTRMLIIKEEEDTLTGPATAVETYLVGVDSNTRKAAALATQPPSEDAYDDEYMVSLWDRQHSQLMEDIENRLLTESVQFQHGR